MPATTLAAVAAAAALHTAIITSDNAALRAAPRDSAQQQAELWQGEVVEVRGERLDYLQVYDHNRERAGFVKASQARRMSLTADEAPELLSVLRFVQARPGSEALGIGLAAAYLQAAPAEMLSGEAGVAAFDALGTLADRLAQRASSGASLTRAQGAALSAHLEVARGYGVKMSSYETKGKITVCYDGEAFRRVLAMQSTSGQRARAALALTRPQCVDPELAPLQRSQVDQWRADVLERVETGSLPAYLKNRVLIRRASIYSAIAYQRMRQNKPGDAAAQRALVEFAGISKRELTDVDLPAYNDAAMRVNASRWAAVPAPRQIASHGERAVIITKPGAPGETCVLLVDAKHDESNALARRCTYSVVWANSASMNREGTALALAVQPLEAWRELWLFRKDLRGGWSISVLPPGTSSPELGYAEFAGWVPGGKKMLLAREARGEGSYRKTFEVLKLDSLTAERQAKDAEMLGAFVRWQDAEWKAASVSLR